MQRVSIRRPLLVWAIYTFAGPTIGMLSLFGMLAAFEQAEWFSRPQSVDDWIYLATLPIAALFYGGLPAFATGMVMVSVAVSRVSHVAVSAMVGGTTSLIWGAILLPVTDNLGDPEWWAVCAGIGATGLVAALVCGLLTVVFRSQHPDGAADLVSQWPRPSGVSAMGRKRTFQLGRSRYRRASRFRMVTVSLSRSPSRRSTKSRAT